MDIYQTLQKKLDSFLMFTADQSKTEQLLRSTEVSGELRSKSRLGLITYTDLKALIF